MQEERRREDGSLRDFKSLYIRTFKRLYINLLLRIFHTHKLYNVKYENNNNIFNIHLLFKNTTDLQPNAA